MNATKRCSKCGDEKELIVEINPTQRWCRECFRNHARNRYAENPEKYRAISKQARGRPGWKRGGRIQAICEQCGESYLARKDGLNKYCSLKCTGESQRTTAKVQCQQCGEPFHVPKSRKENFRGKFCSKECADKAKVRYSAAQLKLSRAIRGGIIKSLKSGSKAGRHWEVLVGYTRDEAKTHLEKRFSTGMTWENHGTCWHIDHILPIAAFNFERPEDIDFKRCWSLKNLQPLYAKDNMSKGAKYNKQNLTPLTGTND